jgi:hypothetical protein
MPEDFTRNLPIWGVLLLGTVWLVLREVVPRINVFRADRASRKAESIHPPAPLPAGLFEEPLSKLAQDNADRADRFDALLERHFESDKQQFELLRMLAIQAEQSTRTLGQIAEAMVELKVTVRAVAQTQESLFKLVREDTGRFNLPPPRG